MTLGIHESMHCRERPYKGGITKEGLADLQKVKRKFRLKGDAVSGSWTGVGC